MKTWMIGGLVAAGAVGAYFTTRTNETHAPAPVAPETPSVTTAPVTPVALIHIVNVTDIDFLLDPPTIPVADPDVPPAPVMMHMAPEHTHPRRPAAPTALPVASD